MHMSWDRGMYFEVSLTYLLTSNIFSAERETTEKAEIIIESKGRNPKAGLNIDMIMTCGLDNVSWPHTKERRPKKLLTVHYLYSGSLHHSLVMHVTGIFITWDEQFPPRYVYHQVH